MVKNGQAVFCKSIDLGVVKIKDAVGQDFDKVRQLVQEKIKEFGVVPESKFYGIGGTATSLAGILLELEPYDPSKVNGYEITIDCLEKLNEKLFSMTEEQKRNLKGLQPERAGVIAGGSAVILQILKMANAKCFTVSESDNLEGYLLYKLEKDEKND